MNAANSVSEPDAVYRWPSFRSIASAARIPAKSRNSAEALINPATHRSRNKSIIIFHGSLGVSVISKTRRRCGRRPYIHGLCFSRLQISRFPDDPPRGVCPVDSRSLFVLPRSDVFSSVCLVVFRSAASFLSFFTRVCAKSRLDEVVD